MPVFEEFYFTSTTGLNTIRALKCSPDTAPKAVVQIAHGIAEHVDRYREFMSFLAENGYVAVANDHLGHGKSIVKSEEKGFFALHDGWDHVVMDMNKLRGMMKMQYPNLPYVFFGHSMGSFLTRTYLVKYPDNYAAAVISGTGHLSPLMINGGYMLASFIAKKHGAMHVSDLVDKIAFGAYNKEFEPARTKFDWLSRDEAEVDKYAADPLCGFIPSVGLFKDMMGGLKFITNQANINKMNKAKPIYFMSGAKDPVGENGAGVERAYKAFCKAGLKDIYMKLYPDGRHEMLNETNKYDVYKDILNWIDSKI